MTNPYLTAIQRRLALLDDETDAIGRAAQACARTIADRGVVHVFGAGHSRMAAEEAYPRIGAVVGFNPVVELAVTYFHDVVGTNGLDQALFLERVPGYGRVILESLDTRPGDSVVVVSSSGVEAIIIDFVEAAKEAGLTIIGVTSLEYSQTASDERGGATTLAELADHVIDNHVPVGDALVDLDGLTERVGPSASILNLAVIDALTVATAQSLLDLGEEPLVFSSPHLQGQEESERRYRQCLDAYAERVRRIRPAAPADQDRNGGAA